ncbi:hypothetical protein [Mycolicibacterium lacusdiani]|uniref:hypothetical protein n=1 Tax=Mycolicibacterium lacusdiani TaxID=2895283 RepID=UPI001F348B0D|nr:hypothetical protein [Mycolicibacterium lacusdiani]
MGRELAALLRVVVEELVVRARPVVVRARPVAVRALVAALLVAELPVVVEELVVRARPVVPAELVAELPVVAPELVVERAPVVAEPQVVAVEQPVVVQAAVRLVQAEVAVPVVSVERMRPHCRPHRVSSVATRARRHLWARLTPAPVSSAMAAVQERVAAQAQAVVQVSAAVVLMWDNSSTRPVPVQARRSTLQRAWEPLSERRFRRQLRSVAAPRSAVVLLLVAVLRLVAEPRLVVVLRLVR